MEKTVEDLMEDELNELYWEYFSNHFRNDFDILILNLLNQSHFQKTFYTAMGEFLKDINFNKSNSSSISLLKQLLLFISEDLAKIIYEEFDQIHSDKFEHRILLEKVYQAGKARSKDTNNSKIRKLTKAKMDQLNHYLFETDIYSGDGDDIEMKEYTPFHAYVLSVLNKYLFSATLFSGNQEEAVKLTEKLKAVEEELNKSKKELSAFKGRKLNEDNLRAYIGIARLFLEEPRRKLNEAKEIYYRKDRRKLKSNYIHTFAKKLQWEMILDLIKRGHSDEEILKQIKEI